ncbi:MAG: patatin-like phospholipase family protein [Bradymonadales bacterium]|nr:MAG: patatin-like phospholipase family protein [Bradymonadales bacterium]
MASLESKPEIKRKYGIHLLGGGVTGAFFHFGVLAALDDHLSKRSTEFDVFVGSSAGSLVSTSLAVGLRPQQIVEAMMKDDQSVFHIEREDIYRFSFLDWGAELIKFFWTLFYIIFVKVQDPKEAPSFFWGLKDSLPSGLFAPRYYEAWIKEFFESKSLPTFFSQLEKELYIPATDVDSTKRVVFGSEHWRHIPFYKAISASSAIPIFFKPVQIEDRYYMDGGLGKLAHLDLQSSSNVKLVIMINPMVPVNNDHENVRIKTVFEERGRIKDKGLTYVFDQAMRTELFTRVHTALHHMGYRDPDMDILLIEPDQDDSTMFLFNPMDFESRRQIVEYGYELTRRKLREQSELWKKTLDRHQVTLVGS